LSRPIYRPRNPENPEQILATAFIEIETRLRRAVNPQAKMLTFSEIEGGANWAAVGFIGRFNYASSPL